MSEKGKFSGFAAGSSRLIMVPGQFITELLPLIESLDELRLCLYFIWRLERMEGSFHYLRAQDILEDALQLALLGEAQQTYPERLSAAQAAAVEHGALLRARLAASVLQGEAETEIYFLNSPRGRAALEAIQRGAWQPVQLQPPPLDLSLDSPNIFRLYEENIGPLTPLIADALRDAEQSYPYSWIEEAVRIAAERNKRNWRYIAAILDRWQLEGHDERKDRRDSEEDRRRYREWETPSDRARIK